MPLRLNHTTTIICSSVFKIKQVYGDKITVFPGTEWYVLSRNNNKESRHIPSVILTRQETDCPHIPFWNPIELMHATVNLSGKHGNNSHGQGLSHWHFWSWIKKPRHVHFRYQFDRDKLNQATLGPFPRWDGYSPDPNSKIFNDDHLHPLKDTNLKT